MNSQIKINKVNHSFAQDAYILLKDTSDNTKNYAIKTNTFSNQYPFNNNQIQRYTNCNEHLHVSNGNHFGGNFISSPENIIFTFDNSNFSECLNNNLKSKVVNLNCSFRYNNERHIDETMCFMPYGTGNYKVWIYNFRTIKFDSTLVKVKEMIESKKIDKIVIDFNILKDSIMFCGKISSYKNHSKLK